MINTRSRSGLYRGDCVQAKDNPQQLFLVSHEDETAGPDDEPRVWVVGFLLPGDVEDLGRGGRIGTGACLFPASKLVLRAEAPV